MKRIMLLLTLSCLVANTKAETIKSIIEQIYKEGADIKVILEKNLESEFKKQSDKFFNEMATQADPEITKSIDGTNIIPVPDILHIIRDFLDDPKLFQANLKVDLALVLDSAIDKELMDKIVVFLKNAETEVNNLINLNTGQIAKYREMQSRGVQWPHSPHFRRLCEGVGFAFRPMMIKRDKMICDSCNVEASGLIEDETGSNQDIPLYYHKVDCKTKAEISSKMENSAIIDMDNKLTVRQRIQHAAENPISGINLLNAKNEKYLRFAQFYRAFGQIPGWILVNNFLQNPCSSGDNSSSSSGCNAMR